MSARRSSLSGSESYFGLIIGALNSWNASFSILNRIYVRFTAMKCDPDKNSLSKTIETHLTTPLKSIIPSLVVTFLDDNNHHVEL